MAEDEAPFEAGFAEEAPPLEAGLEAPLDAGLEAPLEAGFEAPLDVGFSAPFEVGLPFEAGLPLLAGLEVVEDVFAFFSAGSSCDVRGMEGLDAGGSSGPVRALEIAEGQEIT